MNQMEKLYNTLKEKGVISSSLSYEDYCKQKEGGGKLPPTEVVDNFIKLPENEVVNKSSTKILFEDTLTGQEREDFLEAFAPFEE